MLLNTPHLQGTLKFVKFKIYFIMLSTWAAKNIAE